MIDEMQIGRKAEHERIFAENGYQPGEDTSGASRTRHVIFTAAVFSIPREQTNVPSFRGEAP
jgi:hypothetical protein